MYFLFFMYILFFIYRDKGFNLLCKTGYFLLIIAPTFWWLDMKMKLNILFFLAVPVQQSSFKIPWLYDFLLLQPNAPLLN